MTRTRFAAARRAVLGAALFRRVRRGRALRVQLRPGHADRQAGRRRSPDQCRSADGLIALGTAVATPTSVQVRHGRAGRHPALQQPSVRER